MRPSQIVALIGGHKLHLPFAAQPDQPTTDQFDLVTFAQSATLTRTNSSGALELRTGLPAYEYDPVTLASKGWRAFEQRTNLLVNSKLDGTNLASQNVIVLLNPYTLSFYGTGTIVISGTASVTLTGSGAYPTRSTLTFTPLVGLLIMTVTGTVQFANFEQATKAGPFIPTAGGTAVSVAATASITSANIEFAFGTTRNAGTAFIEFIMPDAISLRGILYLGNATESRRIAIYVSGGDLVLYLADGIISAATVIDSTFTVGSIVKLAVSWNRLVVRASANGMAAVSVNCIFGGALMMTIFSIGGQIPPASSGNTTVKLVNGWTRAFSAAEIQSVTS